MPDNYEELIKVVHVVFKHYYASFKGELKEYCEANFIVPTERDNSGLTVKEIWQYYPFFTDIIFWKHRILNQDTISYSSFLKVKPQKVVKIEWNWHFFYFSNLFHNKKLGGFIIIILLRILSFLPYWVTDLPNDFTLYHLKYALLPIMSTFRDIIPKMHSGCLKSTHIILIEKHYENLL